METDLTFDPRKAKFLGHFSLFWLPVESVKSRFVQTGQIMTFDSAVGSALRAAPSILLSDFVDSGAVDLE